MVRRVAVVRCGELMGLAAKRVRLDGRELYKKKKMGYFLVKSENEEN